MIHCTLADAQRYAGLHPLFSAALAQATDPELRARGPGRYDLADGMFVMVDEGHTEPASDRRFESHRRYIDIQVILAGPERMQWVHTDGLTIAEDLSEQSDLIFYHQPHYWSGDVIMQPEEIVIFFPEDAHRPCCNPAESALAFKKFVFKVPI